MAELNFNAQGQAQLEERSLHPAGWYVMAITATDLKPTKKGDGRYIAVEYTIVAPAWAVGKKFFDNVNIQNPNPVATEIGQKTLSSMCHATGVLNVQNTEQLHNIPIGVKLSVKGEDNNVRGFKTAGEMTADMLAANVPVVATQVEQAAASPPPAWMNATAPAPAPPVYAPAPAPLPTASVQQAPPVYAQQQAPPADVQAQHPYQEPVSEFAAPVTAVAPPVAVALPDAQPAAAVAPPVADVAEKPAWL